MSNEKFQSKSGFILASIGAAVGLGNALRFPGLCANYGGGAFLLVYTVALVVLGIPLLNAEIALGRRIKGGSPQCMASLCKKRKNFGEKAGWASCANSLVTAVIYAALAGWIIATAAGIVPLAVNAPNLSQTQISTHFFANVLGARDDGAISGFSFLVAGCIVAAWILMYLCLRGGAKTLSKAAKFTVIIPMVLLCALAVRGLMYENAPQALAALFVPDFSALARPDMWLTALGQVFFSLSVAVGVMPVFGSYLPDGENVFSCSLAIAAADLFVSVLASVVLFTTLYGCGLQQNVSHSGILTAFTVYPAAICMLFGRYTALNAAAGLLFYASLAMMAVQSAVSMIEAFLSPFAGRINVPKKKIARVICLIGGVVSLIFATTAAPAVLDLSDKFVNFYNVLLLGLTECLILARSPKKEEVVAEINRFAPLLKRRIKRGKETKTSNAAKMRPLKLPPKLFNASIKYLCPAILVSLTATEVFRLVSEGIAYPLWLQIAFGWGPGAMCLSFGFIMSFLLRLRRLPVQYSPEMP